MYQDSSLSWFNEEIVPSAGGVSPVPEVDSPENSDNMQPDVIPPPLIKKRRFLLFYFVIFYL